RGFRVTSSSRTRTAGQVEKRIRCRLRTRRGKQNDVQWNATACTCRTVLEDFVLNAEGITCECRVVARFQLNTAALYRCSRLRSSLLAKDQRERRSSLSESADDLGSGWIERAFVSDQQLLHLKAEHVVLE